MNITNILPDFIRQSVENPSTSLANPALFLTDFFGGITKSGVGVNSTTALGIPGFWRGIDLWSNTIGSLPLNIFQRTEDGKEILRTHPLFRLLHDQPNNLMTSFQWRKMSQSHINLWGNAYSVIEFDNQINPVGLLPFHPSNVTPVLRKGKIWYQINTGDQKFIVDQSRMLHIKGLWIQGLKGMSLIRILKENLGLAIASQESSANFFKKGMRLDGVITKASPLSSDGFKKLRETWSKTYTGAGGQRVAILDDGMDFKSISTDPEKSQLIDTRKFSVNDIARIVGIPPPLLYDLEKATFANIEKLIQSFEKFDLRPVLVNWEQEMNWKLLKEEEKESTFIEFNVDGLLRGSAAERADFWTKLFMIGAISPNEIRSKENLNSYDKGDAKFIPLNMKENDGTPQTNGQSQNPQKDVAVVQQ